MDFAAAIKAGFVNWRKFSGTASRPEYWYFYLFSWILGQVLNVIDLIVQPNLRTSSLETTSTLNPSMLLSLIPIPSLVVSLLLLVPQLSLAYRRIQDGGRPGWLAFLQFVPLVMAVVFLVVAFASLGNANAIPFLLLFALVVFAAAVAWLVLYLIWTISPTKTAAQGNKYAN